MNEIKQYYTLRFLLASGYETKVTSNKDGNQRPENLAFKVDRNFGRDDFNKKGGQWHNFYAESLFKVEILDKKGNQIAMFFSEVSNYKSWLSTLDEAIKEAKSYSRKDTSYIYKRGENIYELSPYCDNFIFAKTEVPKAKVEYINNEWVVSIRNMEAKYGAENEWILQNYGQKE